MSGKPVCVTVLSWRTFRARSFNFLPKAARSRLSLFYKDALPAFRLNEAVHANRPLFDRSTSGCPPPLSPRTE